MRARGVPLWSLESGAAVRDAALWGFTLQHELTYTNILEMLDLAGVPLHAASAARTTRSCSAAGPGRPTLCRSRPSSTPSSWARPRAGWPRSWPRSRRRAGAERLAALGAVPGVWLPAARRRRRGGAAPAGVRARQVFTGFSRHAAVERAAGAADRGGPRSRRHRGHARLQRRLPVLPGRRLVPAGARAPGRDGRRGRGALAAGDRLRRGLADLAVVVRLRRRARGGRRHPRAVPARARLAAVAARRFGGRRAGRPGRRAARLGHPGARGRHPGLRDAINKRVDEADLRGGRRGVFGPATAV